MRTIENNKIKNQKSLYLKIGFILLLILLLMIPNALIQSLIYERQSLDDQVKREIASDWGPAQNVIGPILSIPYTAEVEVDDKKKLRHHTLRTVPELLDIDVNLTTNERQKGIYKAVLYTAEHGIKGSFDLPKASEFGASIKEIHWDKATIDLGFTSASSLNDIVSLNWNNKTYKMEAGASSQYLFPSGIHSTVDIDPSKSKYSFSLNVGINGSESLNYLPIAGNTSIKMQSSWDSPGFNGLPAPQSRKVSKDGFTAEWKSTEYNRPFKSHWKNYEIELANYNAYFGVDLVQTVGHYQKNMRSAKYALLIISLSFLIFFFFEILKGSKIHPVQYIFIGLALSVFYILLLSFSEQIGFNRAYMIAALSTTGLISWYSKFLLQSTSKVVILTATLWILYAYIFTLLQMEDLALLVGSLGLFAALAITMHLSRNMDWYALGSQKISSNSAVDLAEG